MNKSKKHHWFKAKHYGFGWTPAAKEGWFVLFFWVILAVLPVIYFEPTLATSSSLIFRLVAYETALIALLVVISYIKGEPPRWRWGKEKNTNYT